MLTCRLKQTIKEALQRINENTKGCVFIVDESNRVKGILTDGDIRRALLMDCGLDSFVEEYMTEDFVFARKGTSSEEIYAMFNEKISIIPIVDEEMRYIDYVEYRAHTKISLAQPQLIGNEYKYLNEALLSTWISSSGEYINKFEEAFSNYCGVKYGVATSNGTTALHLALVALGIKEGDEVIVPNLTFAATINSVIYTGATPVIVDIEEDSWCIDPSEIEKYINEKTKAIIPVHIYGQPCNMERICDIAKKHNLYIVEDCAEAHGATFDGKKVGSFGDISCFSFFGNKVITTGEGGMCLTNDGTLHEKMRILRDHGMSKNKRYYHEVVGFNYRMTNMQAAIGLAQVERIEDILSWRAEVEKMYREQFKDLEIVTLQNNQLFQRGKISWLVSVLVDCDKRNKFIEALKANDIDARAFFVPMSKMDIYKKYVVGKCCVSEKIASKGINLPTTYEVDANVVSRIKSILEKV